MTTLPERLRASAQEMRGLFLVSENVPNVRMIYKEDRDRIAAELTEAADALEGGHVVTPGDWIITGVNGENYPCKPHIFEATYEPA